jgi:hypothetical protein
MSLKLTDSETHDGPKLTDGPPREAAPEPVTPSNTAA